MRGSLPKGKGETPCARKSLRREEKLTALHCSVVAATSSDGACVLMMAIALAFWKTLQSRGLAQSDAPRGMLTGSVIRDGIILDSIGR